MDGSVKVYKTLGPRSEQALLLKTLQDHTQPVTETAFHPNGHVLASASTDCSIKLYDLSKAYAKRGFRFIQDVAPIKSFAFHPSGDFVLVGTRHPTLRLFDVHTLKCFTIRDKSDLHTGPLTKTAYSPLGNVFATASEDGSIRLYDTQTSSLINHFTTQGSVSSLSFSRNGKYLLSSGADHLGRLWDIGEGKTVVEYKSHGALALTAWSFDESFVLGSDDTSNALSVWNAKTGEFIRKLGGQGGRIRALASNPALDSFVTCSDDTKARYWENTGK